MKLVITPEFEQLLARCSDPREPAFWLLVGAAMYYLYGFVIVRHIYREDEERLGPVPFNRFAHVILFVAPIAFIWPVPWLNWSFRESEASAERWAERERECEANRVLYEWQPRSEG